MNKKISDCLTMVVTRFFQQNFPFRTQLKLHGSIEVVIDSTLLTWSIDEKIKKQTADGNLEPALFPSQTNLSSHLRNPRTLSESTNMTFDADEAAVDAAVSMIDDFDEAMLSLGDGLGESRGLRAGLGASNSSLLSVDRLSSTSERTMNMNTPRTCINIDSILPYEKSWCTDSTKAGQNERNISVKDLELLLASERLTLTPKPQMALVPVMSAENQLQNPIMNLTLGDVSKSLLPKDKHFASASSNSALLPVQPTLSQTWNQILQFLVSQSPNLDISNLTGLIENITTATINRPIPNSVPVVTAITNIPTSPHFSESFLQELSSLLHTSQGSVDIADLYNPDFSYEVDNVPNLPVPPNSPTRPESRLGPLMSSNEFFSNLETYQMPQDVKDSEPQQTCRNEYDSNVLLPGARKRTESEISVWQPQVIQTMDTGHEELNELTLPGENDVEQKSLTLQESIEELLSGKDTKLSGLQNDVWFGHGKSVVERSDKTAQAQENTRHRHMSENLQMSRHGESLRHRHMSENVRHLFSETQVQDHTAIHDTTSQQTAMSENVHHLFSETQVQDHTPIPDPTSQQTAMNSQDIFAQVHQDHIRQRHASENVLFSQEHATHTRMRHRSEHTLGFTQVNDEPTRMRHLSGNVTCFSHMSEGPNQRGDSSGNTDMFSNMSTSNTNRIRHSSGGTDVFSPAPVNTGIDHVNRVRNISGDTQSLGHIDSDVTRLHHNSGETQGNQQLDLNVAGIVQNVQDYAVTQLNGGILNLNPTTASHLHGNADEFQTSDLGGAGMNETTDIDNSSGFQHHNMDIERVRQLSGDQAYTGINHEVRSRHLSGSIQECSQFGSGDLASQLPGTARDFSGLFQGQPRSRHTSGDVQAFQQGQELNNQSNILLDGQYVPQVDAEVRQILQGSIAPSVSHQMHLERNQTLSGIENTLMFSPVKMIKMRHASVTFSPVVSVVQREASPVQPVASEVYITSGDTTSLSQPVQDDASKLCSISATAAFLAKHGSDDVIRSRHASETAAFLTQAHEEANRIRHASETLQRTNKRPQPTALLVFNEILDGAKRMKVFDNVNASQIPLTDNIQLGQSFSQVQNLSENLLIVSPTPQEQNSIQIATVQDQTVADSDWLNQNEEEEDDDDIPLSQYRYKCPVCEIKIRDMKALEAHKLHVHNNMRCVTCFKKCRDLHRLAQHIRRHTNTPRWTCDICGKGFIYANSFKLHQMKHENDRPYLCEHCGKSYTSHGQLESHKREHKDPKQFGNVCPVCGKVFKTKSNLKIHLVAHSDIRPWVCDLCGKSFKTKQTLTTHTKTHSNVRPYVCQICGRAFKQVEALISHKQTHNAETEEHQCKDCSKIFKSSYYLRDHMRLVHNRSTFQCTQCSQSFKTKPGIENHILKKHTNPTKMFNCPLCQGIFPEERYLKEHLRCEHAPLKKRRTKKQQTKRENAKSQPVDEASLSVSNLLQQNGQCSEDFNTKPLSDFKLIKSIEVQNPTALVQMVPIDLNSIPPQTILAEDVGSVTGSTVSDGAFVQYIAVGSNIDIESSAT